MAITYAQICDSIETYLAIACPSVSRTQSYDELTEGMNDTPTLQVYPEACENVATESGTQFSTFQGGVIQSTIIVHVDYYARQRNHIGEDMAALVAGLDELHTAFEEAGCPPFGLEGIRSFQWAWNRVIFAYASVEYLGARFVLRLRTF